ncbi:uncharacterized protein LOC135397952 [Ornithodoros turicata]|uniref:uncharacterized protein LOC135397952 n=1 Tax=Ornithodoros turicata TaxID=34597 RepID=UPI003139EE63
MSVLTPLISSLLLLALLMSLVLFQLKTMNTGRKKPPDDYIPEISRRSPSTASLPTTTGPGRERHLTSASRRPSRRNEVHTNLEDVSQIPDECFRVSVAPCSRAHGRSFYLALSPVGPFCTEWLQHTHCPIHKDRFSVYANCDTACRGGQCDYPSFRLCTTEDKVFQYYFSNGQCHSLPDSENGCLHGWNRFERVDECLASCNNNRTRSNRCMDPMRVSPCAFDHMRYLYYYNNASRVCEMYNFCATTSFKTRVDCERRCRFQKRTL